MALTVSGVATAALPTLDNCDNERLVSREVEFVGLTYFADNGECVEKEKQISVDPISLRESSVREDVVVPVIVAPDVADLHLPPPLPPTQFKFLSYSLPNSANSSPRFGAGVGLMKKKGKSESQESQLKVSSSTKLKTLVLEEAQFKKSKSCGEGRTSAPADDLDLWLNNPNFLETKNYGGFSRTESNKDYRKSAKKIEPTDDGFKCGALCLFLPGFSKGKAIRSIREEEPEIENLMIPRTEFEKVISRTEIEKVISRTEIEKVISRTVSLEKFECGSWASSALANEAGDDGDSMSLFFDLPMELIRNSVDANAPVSAAFVFDKDQKGVTKNSSTKLTQKSNESSHHVRFSASSNSSGPSSPASCITPRLRKAREEFNAFLEAQSSA